MSGPEKRCASWRGKASASLEDLVRDRLGGDAPPAWLTCEPTNGPAPLPNFSGLIRVKPGVMLPTLVEARLHYARGALHLLRVGGETRWAAWSEVAEDATPTPPAWVPDAATAPDAAEVAVLLASPGRTVLLEPAGNARGLAGATIKSVTLHEYTQGGALRWWRLSDQ